MVHCNGTFPPSEEYRQLHGADAAALFLSFSSTRLAASLGDDASRWRHLQGTRRRQHAWGTCITTFAPQPKSVRCQCKGLMGEVRMCGQSMRSSEAPGVRWTVACQRCAAQFQRWCKSESKKRRSCKEVGPKPMFIQLGARNRGTKWTRSTANSCSADPPQSCPLLTPRRSKTPCPGSMIGKTPAASPQGTQGIGKSQRH